MIIVLISRKVSPDLIPLNMCDFFDVLNFVYIFWRGLKRQSLNRNEGKLWYLVLFIVNNMFTIMPADALLIETA
jgi:hypothetical protein